MTKTNNKPIHVVIPAYEEEKNIGWVIERLKRLNLDLEIWVIDDGSKDGTAEKARKAGAKVVKHFVNLGQWAALRTGFVLALLNEAKTIVSIDADRQHDPRDLLRLVGTLNGENDDLVIGSRFLRTEKPNMLRHRKLGILFFNKLIEIMTKCKLTDCTSGYRAYKADVIQKILGMLREEQYGSLEFIAKIVRQKAKIKEIPIKARTNTSSKKGELRYGYNLFRTILKELL